MPKRDASVTGSSFICYGTVLAQNMQILNKGLALSPCWFSLHWPNEGQAQIHMEDLRFKPAVSNVQCYRNKTLSIISYLAIYSLRGKKLKKKKQDWGA